MSQVAYHYCKPMGDDLIAQCLLYDGTGPDARLIGVEYLVSDAVFEKMPAEEKAYWHDHKYEVDAGLLKSLTQIGRRGESDARQGPDALRQGLPHLVDRKDLSAGPCPAVLGGHG